jgi:hypothetical protein
VKKNQNHGRRFRGNAGISPDGIHVFAIAGQIWQGTKNNLNRIDFDELFCFNPAMPTQTNWAPENGDITDLIERLDALEERNGIRFEALNATFFIAINTCPTVRVCGEIHARDGLEITHRLKVAVTAYDPKGRILDTGQAWIAEPEKFYGFEAFVICLNTLGQVAKVRVYPQLA